VVVSLLALEDDGSEEAEESELDVVSVLSVDESTDVDVSVPAEESTVLLSVLLLLLSIVLVLGTESILVDASELPD
jgi:hypothetical protein